MFVTVGGLLLVAALALVAAAAADAAGHALGAWEAGFRIARRPRAGRVVLDPVYPDRLRARHALVVAGGPAAGLALAAALVGAAAVRGGVALWLGAAVAVASGLARLAPLELGGRWTDGRWLLTWLRRPELAAQRLGLGALRLAKARGGRPRDWSERWSALAAGGPRLLVDRAQVAGCLLAYARALDRGEVDRAAALLARAFAARRHLPPRTRPSPAIESAFFVARFRGDGRLGALLLEADVQPRGTRVSGTPLPELTAQVERARAAVLLAAGRRQEAAAACDRALALLDRPDHPAPGLAELSRDLLRAMRAEALPGAPAVRAS